MHVQRVLVWMHIAAVFTVALYPAANWLQSRVRWCRRSMATLVVFLVVLLAFGGVLTLFAIPLAEQGTQLATRLPDMIADARGGRGPVGVLLERTNAPEFARDNEERIRQFATGLGTRATATKGRTQDLLWQRRTRSKSRTLTDPHRTVAAGAAPRQSQPRRRKTR